MKWAAYFVAILIFPIAIVLFDGATSFFEGRHGLGVGLLIIVSGGPICIRFLKASATCDSAAKALGYILLAILGGAFAAAISWAIAAITVVLMPFGHI